MTTASAEPNLDEVLTGELDRDNFDQLTQAIYESYASVDLADSRIRQLEQELERATGDSRRDLTAKLGILHFARGNHEAAIEKLQAVHTRKNASHFLGRAYLKVGDPHQALEHLANGRSGDDDLLTDVLMVEAHCDLRQPEEARKVLKQHAKDEECADLPFAEGRVAEATGEYGEAMEHYEAALELDAEHAGALFRLALNCDLNGDDERAMELYARCAGLKPAYVGALMNLGVLYEDNGRYYEAIDCYKRVLAIAPRHKRAQLYLKDAESSLTMYVDMAKRRRMRRLEEIFSLPVASFELSTRSRNALDRKDITTLGGLAKLTPEDLLTEKNFGDTSLEEIQQLLGRYDLGLGEQAERGGGFVGGPELDEATLAKLAAPVESLDLPTRCRKCMDRLGVRTVGQLTQLTEEHLLSVPNFGTTSLNELKKRMDEIGLSLKTT